MHSLGKNSVLWRQLELSWDGTWTISVKCGLAGLAAEWLDRNLTTLLADVPGFDGGTAIVHPAEWYPEGDQRSGVLQWGFIELGNLSEPLPGVAALQETVEAAGNEALTQGERLEATGRKYLAQHRARTDYQEPRAA